MCCGSAGFTINGYVKQDSVLRKSGLQSGQSLILTKALGTGTIMAAAMHGAAKGRWIATALASMQQSSGKAAAILQQHGCMACTDVTGFGLLGHVVEMAEASKVCAPPCCVCAKQLLLTSSGYPTYCYSISSVLAGVDWEAACNQTTTQ